MFVTLSNEGLAKETRTNGSTLHWSERLLVDARQGEKAVTVDDSSLNSPLVLADVDRSRLAGVLVQHRVGRTERDRRVAVILNVATSANGEAGTDQVDVPKGAKSVRCGGP